MVYICKKGALHYYLCPVNDKITKEVMRVCLNAERVACKDSFTVKISTVHTYVKTRDFTVESVLVPSFSPFASNDT